MWRALVLIISLVAACQGSRILAIIPTPSYSHQIAFKAIWNQLSLQGHEVVVLTTDPSNNKTLTNLKEHDIGFLYEVMEEYNVYESMIENENNFLGFMEKFRQAMHGISKRLMQNQVIDTLKTSKPFDVVLVEAIFPEYLIFGEIFNAPTILISSLDTLGGTHQSFGNPANLVAYPDVVLPFFGGDMTFKERITSAVYYLYVHFFFIPSCDKPKNEMLRKYFRSTINTVENLKENADMLFINVNSVLHEIRPYGPTTVTFSGGNHMTAAKKLPKDVQEFLDNSPEGVIYFSLGSNVRSRFLGKEKLTIILNTLKELPYKVLWKFENDELEGKPDNVKIVKWTQQQDVLKHKNVKLFITQGGWQSSEESIYSHVPMVVMPFFGDQLRNARRIFKKGLGQMVQHKNLVKEEFLSTILEVINNKKYRDAVEAIAKLSLDQPMSGVEKAVWWTEYVIRNKGAKHLRDPIKDIPFYQYYLLDVINAVLSPLVIIYVLYKFVRR